MLNKDIIYQIKNTVKESDTKYTPLIYISGSSTIPFINNPHDIDVIAYLSNDLPMNKLWDISGLYGQHFKIILEKMYQ